MIDPIEGIDVVAETFHVLDLADTIFYIDIATRRQIETFLHNATGPRESITIDDLAGAEILILAGRVNGIWLSSPDTRAFYIRTKRHLETEDL